jgi:hypothetical protein
MSRMSFASANSRPAAATPPDPGTMRIFLLIYTAAMMAGSIMTLSLVPRSLRDLGRERERVKEDLPDVNYEQMVEAGYRFNFAVLMLEIIYYYLLVGFARSQWVLFYGGALFGLIHIAFLVASRFERRRLKREYTRSRSARALVWLTGFVTVAEVCFLSAAFLFLLWDFE